jgi:hypothetical protein
MVFVLRGFTCLLAAVVVTFFNSKSDTVVPAIENGRILAEGSGAAERFSNAKFKTKTQSQPDENIASDPQRATRLRNIKMHHAADTLSAIPVLELHELSNTKTRVPQRRSLRASAHSAPPRQ